MPKRVLDAKPALRAYGGKAVTLGIRPEDLEDATLATDIPADQRFKADVELVEALGLRADGPRLHRRPAPPRPAIPMPSRPRRHGRLPAARCASAGSAPEAGSTAVQTIDIAVTADRLYFFDPDTGEAIRS